MLVPCPRCDGRSVVNPFQQKMDVDCPMCAGQGEIDNEYICDCGRPGHQLLNNQIVCGAVDCLKRVQLPTLPLDQALTEQDVEDGFGWGGWAGMH